MESDLNLDGKWPKPAKLVSATSKSWFIPYFMFPVPLLSPHECSFRKIHHDFFTNLPFTTLTKKAPEHLYPHILQSLEGDHPIPELAVIIIPHVWEQQAQACFNGLTWHQEDNNCFGPGGHHPHLIKPIDKPTGPMNLLQQIVIWVLWQRPREAPGDIWLHFADKLQLAHFSVGRKWELTSLEFQQASYLSSSIFFHL